MMIILKIAPEYFQPLIEGRKPFEIRYNDRNYQVGDKVLLREYKEEDDSYTGRVCLVKIKEIFKLDRVALFKDFIAFTFDVVLGPDEAKEF